MAELRTLQGHILLLPEGGISVGADPENEVPVAAHLGLAPVHFRLQPWEGGHFIEDAGSGLGTLVNGHPVNWKPLVHGDAITAGELEVVYNQQATSALGIAPVLVVPPAPASPSAPSSPPVPAFAQAEPTSLPFETAPATWTPTPAWEPSAESPPPAWLPADLLPAGYQSAQPEKSSPTATSIPADPAQTLSTEPVPAWLPSQPRRKNKPRRLVPLAAAFMLILGAGAFFAWQQGILPKWLEQMEGMGNRPSTEAIQTAQVTVPAPVPTVKLPPPPAPAPVPAPPRAPAPEAAPVEIRAAIPVQR